jgi:hypothetical protein
MTLKIALKTGHGFMLTHIMIFDFLFFIFINDMIILQLAFIILSSLIDRSIM